MRGALVTVGGRQYEVIPDLRAVDRAFAIAAVTDDADGRAIAREVTLASNSPATFSARSDREVALAGNPNLAFIDRSVPHSVTLDLSAPGYRDASVDVTIPAFAPLPHRHDIALRRLPFTMTGRVFGRSAGPNPTFDPLAGAALTISPIPAAGGELPLLLRQPLRADAGAAATIRRRAIAPLASVAAIDDALAGQALLAIDDGSGVADGQLLRVGPNHRRFYAEVAQLIAHPDRPAPAALLTLTEGLAGTVGAGAMIDRFNPGGFSGSTGNLIGAAHAGEAVISLDALPAAGGVLVLREAGQPDRYHDAQALSGPNGDYLIAGMARIDAPAIEVSAAGFTTNTSTYEADHLRAGPVDWYLVP
ncbi:hypothetical protein D6850_08480 [Roseovarius spongiae]|uniref:Uncharacterized protein n=1 Tax=Roseovarius spongiae TaxID=2320272 RepID=A0A3A8B5J0_9RHOB|nr:hypothetical protein [Roseovarius spongiae]RKF14896.1 hypothetical protein D6850_08480 [Roseovarius spongiae]